jgi:hypothetical protein
VPDPASEFLQVFEDRQFLVQFGERARRRSGVGDLGLDVLCLAAGQVIEFVTVVGQVLAEQFAEPLGQVVARAAGSP